MSWSLCCSSGSWVISCRYEQFVRVHAPTWKNEKKSLVFNFLCLCHFPLACLCLCSTPWGHVGIWIGPFLCPTEVCGSWLLLFVFWVVLVVESVWAVRLRRGRHRQVVVVAVVVGGIVVRSDRGNRRREGLASPRFVDAMSVRLCWCSEGWRKWVVGIAVSYTHLTLPTNREV